MQVHKPVVIACSSYEYNDTLKQKLKKAGIDDYYVCPIYTKHLPKIFQKME